ncbi:hypothetical protein [uncultured Amaricoccus sp.]|uniref:hypothetical protein n=1 Tax=uncultured Amaricoccus sp. TaxID=339341 RepID=UPI002628FBA0|nr:hypothetical protein [uncultured Amaricoccus sp.]
MAAAYGEFELDIPKVMRAQLPAFFATLPAAVLTPENVERLPDGAQGAYLLFLDTRLVYVGKTDAQAGFRGRLARHAQNIQHRRGLAPERMSFKAARIFVFSTFDLETMLIEEFTRLGGERPAWNFSGFGSNDPGRNREGQAPAAFDRDYPVDIDQPVEAPPPGPHPLFEVMLALKARLPYLFRYEADGMGASAWRGGHRDMMWRTIEVPAPPVTTRALLLRILAELPPDWQATVLPNRVILYRETRTYPAQLEALRREG